MAISWSIVICGFLMSSIVAVTISVKLCGGIFVAIPTAMPSEPLTNKFGKRAGKTFGSDKDSS